MSNVGMIVVGHGSTIVYHFHSGVSVSVCNASQEAMRVQVLVEPVAGELEPDAEPAPQPRQKRAIALAGY